MEKSLKSVFTKIKQDNYWGNESSVSGSGSDFSQTETIRKALPAILKEYGVKYMIDAPCGDFFWMKEIKNELEEILDKYEGYDIVEEITTVNNSLFSTKTISFKIADITADRLPKADLIFTRDCLVHLNYKNIAKAIKNYKKSGIKYLLTSTFTERTCNYDINNGDWRPLNLEKAPFNFPKPLLLINENCTENGGIFKDKSLGLWEIDKIKNLNTFILFLKRKLK